MEQSTVSKLMLSLCRAALRGEQSPLLPQSEQELTALYAMADYHDMAHMVSLALWRAGCLDASCGTGAKFQKTQMLAVYRCEHQRAELERVCGLLEQEGIAHVTLKGAVIRSLYPEAWMRTSSDVDVLIHSEDIPRAVELMTERLGYRKQSVSTPHDVSLYSPSGVHIELHFDLMEQDREDAVAILLREVWSYTALADGCRYRRVMTDEMFYFYHIAHMAKHVALGGCGVRTLMDLWLLEQHFAPEVREQNTLIARAGLEAFTEVMRKVCLSWFSGEELDELGRDTAAFVLYGGTFGNLKSYVSIQRRHDQGGLRYAFSRIFMPYDRLVTTYPSLKGRRYLTFFYQIRRLFRTLLEGRWRAGVRELKINNQTSDEQTKDVARLFERLGL